MLLLLNLIAPQPIPIQSISRLAPLNQSTTKYNGVNNDIIIANNFMEGYKNYREIIIEGRGLNEQQASLNASTKALQQLAGVFMDVRETDQLDVVDQNGKLKKNYDRFEFTQSFYSDGSIRSFEKLAVKSNNGITTVIAKVSVWLDLQNKSNQHPLLRSNLSGKIRNIQSISGIKGKGIGRTYQLALINAMEEAISSVSLSIHTVESLRDYVKVRQVIGKYVNSIDVDTIIRAKLNSSKAVQGIIQSMEIVSETQNNDLFIVDIIATVRPNDIGAYLSNVN